MVADERRYGKAERARTVISAARSGDRRAPARRARALDELRSQRVGMRFAAGTGVALVDRMPMTLEEAAAPAERRRSSRVIGDLQGSWRRGRKTVTVRALDVSLHGLLLATEEWIGVNQVMDIELLLPDGPVSLLVTSRSVGGGAIGVAIMIATELDQRRWVSHYHSIAPPRKRAHAA